MITEKLIYTKTRVLFMHELKKRGDHISPETLIIILLVIIFIIVFFFLIKEAGNVLP